MQPDVAQEDVVIALVADLARHVPVRVAELIRAGRDVRRVVKHGQPVRIALHFLAADRDDAHGGVDVPRGQGRPRHIVNGDTVGRKGHLAFAAGTPRPVLRHGGKGRRKREGQRDQGENLFHDWE